MPVELVDADVSWHREARAAADARAPDEGPPTASPWPPFLGVDRATATYVGTPSCARCHGEAADVLSRTAHADALATLEDAQASRDPRCLRCHVVGWGRGGFPGRAGAAGDVGGADGVGREAAADGAGREAADGDAADGEGRVVGDAAGVAREAAVGDAADGEGRESADAAGVGREAAHPPRSAAQAGAALPPPEALANVGCEACHGPGSAHVAAPAAGYGDLPADGSACVACHTIETSPDFRWDDRWPLIAH